jgi:amino acid transporter/nucleotide-binding universal stress UspA family protein
MDSLAVHRPRNVDWKRAAALLYGDWGTSKAYVIGLAFVAAGYSSLPIVLAVCVLTGIVGYNYVIICKHFPDGGGVYSAARDQSRLLAVIGALLLVADLIVTAALSGWSAMSYFKVPKESIWISTIVLVLIIGAINYFGPKHSGSFAMWLAVPTVVVVVLIILWSLPHLTLKYLEPSQMGFRKNWVAFVGVILALSGVEAIANLTGVMKLDASSSPEEPQILHTARKAIWPVAVEVVLGTALLGWAMLSLPRELAPQIQLRYEDMLSFLGEQYGGLVFGALFGKIFSVIVGLIVGLLLLSAVNTAIAALIGLFYLMARDGEMPKPFARLNRHGVPWLPLTIAVMLPILVVAFSSNLESLADLYAIGVVGAITVNLGSCSLNKNLRLNWSERAIMGATFLVLLAVELSIAKTKPNALFFALCVIGLGLSLRSYSQKRAGLRTLTVTEEVAAAIAPERRAKFRLNLSPGQAIMVAARGLTPVLQYALEEARLRQGSLYVLYVKQLAVSLPSSLPETERPRWQSDRQAAEIMYGMLELGREYAVPIIPLFAISEDPAATILDLAATVGVDILMLGGANRHSLVSLLKGNVVTEVAKNLPDNIQLIIHG